MKYESQTGAHPTRGVEIVDVIVSVAEFSQRACMGRTDGGKAPKFPKRSATLK